MSLIGRLMRRPNINEAVAENAVAMSALANAVGAVVAPERLKRIASAASIFVCPLQVTCPHIKALIRQIEEVTASIDRGH